MDNHAKLKIALIRSKDKLRSAKEGVDNLKTKTGMDLAMESGLIGKRPDRCSTALDYKNWISVVLEDPEESKEHDDT